MSYNQGEKRFKMDKDPRSEKRRNESAERRHVVEKEKDKDKDTSRDRDRDRGDRLSRTASHASLVVERHEKKDKPSVESKREKSPKTSQSPALPLSTSSSKRKGNEDTKTSQVQDRGGSGSGTSSSDRRKMRFSATSSRQVVATTTSSTTEKSKHGSTLSATKYRDISPESERPNKCLGVFNLNENTDEAVLTQVFSDYGELESAKVTYNRLTRSSSGYGFVTFVRLEDAIRAKIEANQSKVDGNRIRVDYATTKGERKWSAVKYKGQDRREEPDELAPHTQAARMRALRDENHLLKKENAELKAERDFLLAQVRQLDQQLQQQQSPFLPPPPQFFGNRARF